MKVYTIKEVRELAGTKDIYITKSGYVYKIVKGKKVYILNKKG